MATTVKCGDPPQELVRNLILKDLQVPVVFHGLIDQWEPLYWGLEGWEREIGSQPLNFRIGKQCKEGDPQWESTCATDRATLKQFIHWQNGQEAPLRGTTSDVRPLRCYTPEEVWAYFDYNYMHEVFQDNPAVLEKMNWGRFGFPEKDGSQSVLWIGSKGAHTPCHWDTYGCNLVAQLFGRKRWLLFPPSQSQYLSLTRVPYEESSVYSNINFFSDHLYDSSRYSELQKTFPYVVTLEPGDVLFVPYHWWHFVENLETAVSVNTWIELPSDDESRVEEAAVKFIISLLCRELETSDQNMILNPNEEGTGNIPVHILLSLISSSLQKCDSQEQSRGEKRKLESVEEENVKQRHLTSERERVIQEQRNVGTDVKFDKLIDIFEHYTSVITPVKSFTFGQYLEMTQRRTELNSSNMADKNLDPASSSQDCSHETDEMNLPSQCVSATKDETESAENSSSSSVRPVSDIDSEKSDTSEEMNIDFLKLVINSWTHPCVVKEVRKVLMENFCKQF